MAGGGGIVDGAVRQLDAIYFAKNGTHTLVIKVTSGTFDIDAITVAPY